MLYINHIFFAIVLFVFSLLYFEFSFWNFENIAYIVVVLFFALFPDFDSYSAKFGRNLRFFKWFFSHRGILHSFFGMGLVLFVVYLFAVVAGLPNSNKILVFGFVGYLSHLIADSLTKKGCALFLPFFKFRLSGFIKTGGFLEYFVVSALIVLTVLWLFACFFGKI
ncbi:MAG: hypothetical protein CVU81_03385 [Euryarchaeota archaeon HGW-Euryarchaeota-1]|nr:MAG: hypothetical protein CVU81_03385 [Euryarchaeota archaeon HGW-Euryarchaeota-1]